MTASRNKAGYVRYFFVFFLLVVSQTYAQRRSDLERQKSRINRRIKEASAILKETESQKRISMGQLTALNRKVEAHGELVAFLRKEMRVLSGEIESKQQVIVALENDLQNLKQEYAGMVYSTQKSAGRNQRLAFLFSAESFRDFFIRVDYLKQYAEARNKQIEAISAVKQDLEGQRMEVKQTLEEKTVLFAKEEQERKSLVALRLKQKGLLQKLSRKEKDLKKDLKKYKRDKNKLERLIAEVVRKEVARAKKAKVSKKNATVAVVGKDFSGLRKRLPWPVKSGFLSSRFGKHPHPVLKNIVVRNQGVDIQTSGDEEVRSVHSGVVKSIAMVPGAMKNVVIIQHGDYFTVYAKLKEVRVKSGDRVNGNQTIGVVSTDKTGKSEVQFQVWNNQKNLNPEDWLRRR
ncbi:peptidase M23 [Fulvitalea axinellae]|uniref:Peptidase M23 n=1 Tax=Fulvitalea axinellae TaxID=1182444 RepID=A0AAU9CM28_9BACT|nr:peptidase M23 [Fulvitalea axinellae]